MKSAELNNGADQYFGYFDADIFDCPPFVMFTNGDCAASQTILATRKFEPGSLALWCRLARSATAVFDIGANVGVYSLTAAALRSDIPIYSFEPNPYAAARLRVNKHANKFANIDDLRLALGSQPANAALTWYARPGGHISSGAALGDFHDAKGAVERTVAVVVPLDSLNIPNVGDRPLVKIDVEGAEAQVFHGMTKLLTARPDIILETFLQKSCDAINEIVLPLGYIVHEINEQTGALTRVDRLRPQDPKGANFNQFLSVRPYETNPSPVVPSRFR